MRSNAVLRSIQPFRSSCKQDKAHRKKQGDGVVIYAEPLLRSNAVLRSRSSERKQKTSRSTPTVYYETDTRVTTHLRRITTHSVKAHKEHLLDFNAALRVPLPNRPSVSDPSLHRLGSDPAEMVLTTHFHRSCALCKCSRFGVLRHRLFTNIL